MKDAELVTFGGSGLDRAAQLRGDRAALERLLGAHGTGVLPLWRGKPLLDGPDRAPGWLDPKHPVVALGGPLVFLGLDDGIARFATDVSSWAPDGVSETVGAFFDPSEQSHPDLPDGYVFAELRAIMAALAPRSAELLATARAILSWHQTHQFCAMCGAPSEMAQAGWQRDCPSCGAHHFPRTDPVVIMLVTHGNDVLVGRSNGWPEGMYSLLAGFVEPGETIEAAVRRETVEESGVRVGQVDYLASQPWPFPSSLMFGCHGHALSREISIDPKEIEDARWMSRETMADVVAGRSSEIHAARSGSIARFLIERWLADKLN
ncbi:MAG: NAD(+) diphosphatase [Pseudomonadota bacterium]